MKKFAKIIDFATLITLVLGFLVWFINITAGGILIVISFALACSYMVIGILALVNGK